MKSSRPISTKTVVRYYPVAHHVNEPRKCSRCAARVFSYSTEQTTQGNKTVDERHYCPPCDRVRADYRETMVRNDAFGEFPKQL